MARSESYLTVGMLRLWMPVALAAVLVVGRVQAHSVDVASSNVEQVRKAFERWAAGTGGPYDLLADNASWTITGNSLAAKTYASREEFLSEVIRPFNARMKSPLRPVVRNMYSDGNTVVVLFDASGVAKDDKTYSNTYAWFLEMREGKIVNAVAFFDSIAFDDLWKRTQP